MTSTNSTKAYRASGMLRRIIRLESLPAFKPQRRVRWLTMDFRPQVPIARNERWVIDVFDDSPTPKGQWRRTTDPDDNGLIPPGCEDILYYHYGFDPDENVIYEDKDKDAALTCILPKWRGEVRERAVRTRSEPLDARRRT